MTNEDEWEDIRKAIDVLRKNNYSDVGIYKLYTDAWQGFKDIKTCVEKAKEELSTVTENDPKKGQSPPKAASGSPPADPAVALIPNRKILGAHEDFLKYKNYKTNQIEAIFGVLDALKNEIDMLDDVNIKKKYAYYLEFKGALDEIRNLSPDDSEQQAGPPVKSRKKEPPKDDQWLREQLQEKFKKWVYKVYKYFYWHKDLIAKDKAVQKAWEDYEEFMTNRKIQFISEAQEVPVLVLPNECG